MISEYVAGKIDDAIKNGWIKVYYQPVIRSLTGELCGFESLARWIDPEHGFLSPAQFIGVLEEVELIYKLDIYMIEKVCSDIHDRLENGEDAVPVSINFSRLDFLTCDMLEVVEGIVDKYDIPRDYLHIEITESMMITDGEFMHGVIDGFRNRGYEVWMDDFGSGYSSLNLLKDFTLDMMKLDLKFLSSLNEKSKAIMRSLVSMAKDIGIQTLAEGVETEEEVEFLKEIGCGRLQGYFFGKPMPIEEAFDNLRNKGIKTEGRKWHHFYDMAGVHARSTDAPLELILDDGRNFTTLFMNDAYKLQIFDSLPGLKETDERIYKTRTPLLDKYREFADTIERTKKPEVFYYTVNGNYMCFKGREVAECEGLHIIKGSIQNLSVDAMAAKSEEMDSRLRELNHLFAVVLLFNRAEQKVTPVLGKFRFFRGPEKMDMRKSSEMMAKAVVHPHDRKRYIAFMDASSFAERIEASDFGILEDAFRYKGEDGRYQWVISSLMMIPGTDGNKFLYCVKPISITAARTILDYGSSVSSGFKHDEYSLLWYNILWNSSIMFFWKDKERRFQGASKAFLDYFNLDSADEIIGKLGEEMRWHLVSENYADCEEKILNRGAMVNVSPCQCIIDGVVHNTVSSKLPIYLNGEIVGIMGYIIDVDNARKSLGIDEDDQNTDALTGIMNLSAFIQSLIDYSQQYETSNRNYGLIILKNEKYQRILEDFDKDFSDSVIQVIADKIVDVAGDFATIARIRESYFALLTNTDSMNELTKLEKNLIKAVESINTVEGRSVTIKAVTEKRLRSESSESDELMYASALEELRKA
ncbi:MAG: EAL domain-containing protein [Saccharofermentans sp.]|nr:EAL domain-containing protein [Saccharofermentans sp.]